ncbi:MAG: hypothetical protein AAGI07_03835 [Bacteroidota bacterium]
MEEIKNKLDQINFQLKRVADEGSKTDIIYKTGVLILLAFIASMVFALVITI